MLGMITTVLEIGMTAAGAVMKALGVGAEPENQEQPRGESPRPDGLRSPDQGEEQVC